MMRAPRIPNGAWPGLMRAKTAAGYLDEPSVESFRRKVGHVYPEPIRLKGIGERWSRADLDKWIAETSGAEVFDAAGLI